MRSQADGGETQPTTVIVIMGVAGSGKTTIGTILADKLGWQFADADNFHPAANVAKMSQGLALQDPDRYPWLEALRATILNWLSENKHGVLACSALKHEYRDMLRVDDDRVAFVYLQGDYSLFQERLTRRTGHFMKASMLESQIQTLEEPRDALYIDAAEPPAEIVNKICRGLSL